MKRIIIFNQAINEQMLGLQLGDISYFDAICAKQKTNIFFMPYDMKTQIRSYIHNENYQVNDLQQLKKRYPNAGNGDLAWIANNYQDILKSYDGYEIIVANKAIFTKNKFSVLRITKNDSDMQRFNYYSNLDELLKENYKTLLTSDANIKLLHKYFVQMCDVNKASECITALSDANIEHILIKLEYYSSIGDLVNVNNTYYQNKDLLNELGANSNLRQVYTLAFMLIDNIKSNYDILTLKLNNEITVPLDLIFSQQFDLVKLISDIENEIFTTNNELKEIILNIIINKMIDSNINNSNFYINYIKYITYQDTNQFTAKLFVNKIVDELIKCNDQSLSYQNYGPLHNIFYNTLNNRMLFPDVSDNLLTKLQMDVAINKVNDEKRVKLVSSNTRGKKVAICISGMTRNNIEKTLENILENAGLPLDADFFIHTWDERELYPGTGGIGYGDDKKWTQKYFSALDNVLPSSIDTQAKMFTHMPNSSKIIFTPKLIKNERQVFQKVLGSRLKKITFDNQDQFEQTLTYGNYRVRDNYNQAKMYYGMNKSFELLEQYIDESDSEYEYVMRLRIDSMYKSKIESSVLSTINTNEVLLPITRGAGPDDSVFIAKYMSAKRICKLWEKASNLNYLCPYTQYDKHLQIDGHKLLFAHLMFHKIKPIAVTSDKFIPDYLFTVQVPDISDALNKDIANNQDESIKSYFKQFVNLYCKRIKYNQSYSNIKDIQVEDAQFKDGNLDLVISIYGQSLHKIDKSKIMLKAQSHLEQSTYLGSREYLNRVEVISQTNEKIIISKRLTNAALLKRNAWSARVSIKDSNELEFPIKCYAREVAEKFECVIFYVSYDNDHNLVFGVESKLNKDSNEVIC